MTSAEPGAHDGAGEGGFTILELMVALSIIVVAFVPVTGVFMASLKTSSVAANRTRASSLARRDIEAYRALPYCAVGYTVGVGAGKVAATWTDPVDGQNYSAVDVANPQATQRPASGPDEVMAGTPFHFERHVVWVAAKQANAGATTYSQAYKRTVVIVTWSDQGGASHRVRQDANLYPGGLGTYAAVGAASCHPTGGPTTTAPPKAVTGLTATTDVAAPASKITLTWSLPLGGCNCDRYAIVYSSDNFATTQIAASSTTTATSFPVTGLAPGTPYSFQVYSVQNATGAELASNQASAATASIAPAGGTCTVQSSSLSLSGGSTNVGADQGGATQTLVVPGTSTPTNVNASVVTSGSCTFVRIAYTSIAGDPSVTKVSLTQSGSTWTGVINGTSTNWSIGSHTLSIEDQGNTQLATANLAICAAGKATCP